MENPVNLVNNLKTLSLNLIRIHKICMDSQFKELEILHGPLNANQKLQLLLHAPEFEWLRPLSQLTSLVDGIIFQKEKIQDYKVTEVVQEINRLFISKSNEVFVSAFEKIKPRLKEDKKTEIQNLVETVKSWVPT